MATDVARTPFAEVGGAFRLAARGDEQPVLRLIPLRRRFVHVVPGELVEDELRRKRHQLVERRRQRADVMQGEAGHDRVEGPRILELLDGHPSVEGTCGSVRVDRQDLVARSRQGGSYTSFVAAANLEHATWRLRQL